MATTLSNVAGVTVTAPKAAAPAPTADAVRMTGVVKSFGGVKALQGVDLRIAKGEIHALLGGNGGCEKVQSSVYSKLAGIPVSVLGLAGYIAILASLFVPGENGRLAGAVFALSGFGFSVYLTYREVFSIKAICQWCVGSAVIMTATATEATVVSRRLTCTPITRGSQVSSTRGARASGMPNDSSTWLRTSARVGSNPRASSVSAGSMVIARRSWSGTLKVTNPRITTCPA